MGLIKAIGSAIGSTFKDQWLDLIKCDNMDNDTLMVKQTTKSRQISKGSRIIVAPGQAVVIYDSGSILDASAEEGVYTFDQSSSPSFFGGQFGPVFKEMWQRFTYGGTPAKEQAIFFFNIKEILNNKFGTPKPIPFTDWSHPYTNPRTGQLEALRMSVTCHGLYTYRLDDLALFMRTFAGTADVLKKDVINEQMRMDVISVFSRLINIMGNPEHKIGILELTAAKDDIVQILRDEVLDQPIRDRGIRLVNFSIPAIMPDDESQAKIDRYEYGSDALFKQGMVAASVAEGIKAAGSNAGGAMNGFMGVGLGTSAFGNMMGNPATDLQQHQMFMQMQQQQQQQQNGGAPIGAGQQAAQQQPQGVPCPKCGTMITTKFCPQCGTAAPTPKPAWKCPNCGTENTSNFCTNCGNAKPDGPKKCPDCGIEVTTKFCPNCGKPIQ